MPSAYKASLVLLLLVGCGDGELIGSEGGDGAAGDTDGVVGDSDGMASDAVPGADSRQTPSDGSTHDGAVAPDGHLADTGLGPPADFGLPPPLDMPPGPADVAVLESFELAGQVDCGEEVTGRVTMRNAGRSVWRRDDGYQLVAVDGDPLHADGRIPLVDDLDVLPGQTYTFEVRLRAPEAEGDHRTDWQMARDGFGAFGPVADRELRVRCPAPEEPPPLNLGNVTWLHTNVSGWRETVNLESVTFRGGQICLNHDHADAWPHGDINGVVVAANPWVFIFHDGRWWGATWEWMRPGQTCKNKSSVAGDHIKRAPFDEASGWRPRAGQVLYFMVSGLARSGMRNAEERSNVVRVVWP